VDWDEFAERFGAELRRLGVSDQEARFLGFDAPDARLFHILSILPDGAGVEDFYRVLGADYGELVRREAEPMSSDDVGPA
jgi:hypothetical protein